VIVRLTCPECRKNSYSASVEAFKPCPYCGILFSGKFGSEKRSDYRISREIPLLFSYNGKNLEASTLNVSPTGLSIKIFGQHAFPIGDTMELDVGNSRVKTEIMWTFSDPDSAVAVTGLRIIEGQINFETLPPQEYR
jgi:hypothetical protein